MMKYTLKYKIEGVSSFKNSSEFLVFSKGNNLEETVLQIGHKLLPVVGVTDYLIHNSTTYFSTVDKELFFYENDKLEKFGNFHISNYSNSDFLITKINDDSFQLVNNMTQSKYIIDRNYLRYTPYCKGQLLFSLNNKGEIDCVTLFNVLEWSLDISEIGFYEHPFENLRNQVEVQQFIGIYEDVLWVFLRNRTFLGIDIYKGEVIHKITAFEENAHLNNDYDKSWGLTSQEKLNEYILTMLPLIPDTNWYLDEGNAKIKGLAGYSYVEVDLSGLDSGKKGGLLEGVLSFIKKAKTPSLSVRHFFGQLNSLGYTNLLGRRTVIDEECKYIYFMLANTGRWGIYNTHDYTFEYISEPVVPEELVAQQKLGSLKEIKQGAGKVYILDMQNTLHIFEREETV